MYDIIQRENDNRIDKLEAEMVSNHPIVDCPLIHRFTPGLYIREIFMPKDTLITSKIHKTSHPFTVSKGRLIVNIDMREWVGIEAPYTGITRPGTRRVLYIIEDCIWTTYHPLAWITGKENDLNEEEKSILAEDIISEIIEPHENILVNYKTKQLK